jgi:hypothetical protein
MFKGHLRKMDSGLSNPVEYQLVLGEERVGLNQYLGRKVSLEFIGEINCINCGKDLKKTYAGGYCFNCSQTLARCDLCILKPELCHFHKGTCREPEWGEANCMIPHYVYLSNTSELKVGITRTTQVPTRWVDQGAISALPIIKVSTRLQSGIFEVMLSELVSDKTNWRKMLKGETSPIDLKLERDQLFDQVGEQLDELESEYGEDQIEILEDEEVVNIEYPVLEYPQTVKSLSFDKLPKVEGTFLGIKGQYLIFDIGVINIRKHTGYLATFHVEEK